MPKTTDPLAAILAEMKKRVIGEDGIRYMLSADEVLSFLNSIEVAIKRERALLDANVNRVRELEAMLDGAANTVLDCAIKNKRSDTPGNAAAMREALESTEELLEHFAKPGTMLGDAFFLHMRDNRAALATPARNCDVGTAEEQAERFEQFCLDNHSAEHLCSRCPLGKQLGNDVDMCQLHWAQMPYAPAEGGAKCVNGLRGEPDCRGCNEHCEDVRKRNCFYWNPDIEGGLCALTGKKSCPISCDNFHIPEKVSPPPAEGGAE